MSTVAEQLHSGREARSLTIHQVAEVTKIRTDHIRALESGNFDVFSAPVYIRGFVRSYAVLLKLDVPQVMAELDSELGKTEKFHEPPPLTLQKRGVLDFLTLQLSKLDWRVGVMVAIVVLAVIGIGSGILIWRHHEAQDPLAHIGNGIYQPASSAGETAPLPNTARH
jgi:cytoskeletal protein RodZ